MFAGINFNVINKLASRVRFFEFNSLCRQEAFSNFIAETIRMQISYYVIYTEVEYCDAECLNISNEE